MKSQTRLAFGLFVATVLHFTPRVAAATIVEVDGSTLIPYGTSQADNDANLVVSYSPSLSVCGGGLFYVSPEDKHIFASLITAQMGGYHVTFKYDNAAASKTISAFGVSSSCKIVGVLIDKTSY